MKNVTISLPTYLILSSRRDIKVGVGLCGGGEWKTRPPACGQLAFLTPPFLGGISAEVCEISPHNSDFYNFLDKLW